VDVDEIAGLPPAQLEKEERNGNAPNRMGKNEKGRFIEDCIDYLYVD